MDNISFIPFSVSDFSAFRESSIKEYAQDLIASGQSTEADAHKAASNEFDEILPEGFCTPYHFLYHITNKQGEIIGFIWFESRENDAFICDFAINENQRRKGYGRKALTELERIVGEKGIAIISLHVFEHNIPAIALYQSMGYQVSEEGSGGCFMAKRL